MVVFELYGVIMIWLIFRFILYFWLMVFYFIFGLVVFIVARPNPVATVKEFISQVKYHWTQLIIEGNIFD